MATLTAYEDLSFAASPLVLPISAEGWDRAVFLPGFIHFWDEPGGTTLPGWAASARGYELTGSFGYSDRAVVSGSITELGYHVFLGGYSLYNVSLDIDTYRAYADAGNLLGLNGLLLAGNDTITGDDSDWTWAFGGYVADEILGYDGNDVLYGLDGPDMLRGGPGSDTLNGGAGNDTMIGGTGNDIYVCDAAGDVVTELTGQGDDLVQSTVTYTLPANVERITLTGAGSVNATGNTMNNALAGNAGNNVLNGGGGNDSMAGGAGHDTYVRDTAGDVVTELAGQGNDLVRSSVGYTLPANVERLTLTGAGSVNAIGNGAANVLTGNAGNNVLNGGGGNDVLNGNGGNDTLNGGPGNDTMIGGAGNDTYVRDAAGDVITEAAGQGIDVVQASFTCTLIANLENLALTGSGHINGTGNGVNNVLTGNAGNNMLNGGNGNDTMAGG